MARIRTVKPEFWTAEQVLECSPLARLLFIGMWNFCDDKGVHPASYKTLKAEVMPADDITVAEVKALIEELKKNELLGEFISDNRKWWYVTGWNHQLINRPTPSRYPSPPRQAPLPEAAASHSVDNNDQPHTQNDTSNTDDSLSTHGGLTEDSRRTHGGLTTGKERKGKDMDRRGREWIGGDRDIERANAENEKKSIHPSQKTPCPPDFRISENVQAWAKQHGFNRLDEHLDSFVNNALAKNYQYVDWDSAFKNAIREDWAKINSPPIPKPASTVALVSKHNGGGFKTKTELINDRNAEALRIINQAIDDQENVISH